MPARSRNRPLHRAVLAAIALNACLRTCKAGFTRYEAIMWRQHRQMDGSRSNHGRMDTSHDARDPSKVPDEHRPMAKAQFAKRHDS